MLRRAARTIQAAGAVQKHEASHIKEQSLRHIVLAFKSKRRRGIHNKKQGRSISIASHMDFIHV
jgi:hypothetical protein